MSKDLTGMAQAILNALWKAMGGSQGRPVPVPKVKLNGRRGYGDGEIASPDQSSDRK
jgi:hypothetical protein